MAKKPYSASTKQPSGEPPPSPGKIQSLGDSLKWPAPPAAYAPMGKGGITGAGNMKGGVQSLGTSLSRPLPVPPYEQERAPREGAPELDPNFG